MGVQLVQNADNSVGLVGDATGGQGGFVTVSIPYTASFASTSIMTADRAYVVKAIRGSVDVAGTGGACTFSIYNTPSGTAGASGTVMHTGTYNVAGTANTQQTLSLATTTAAVGLAAGNRIYVALTGTPTSAVGNITITLAPAS